MDRRFVKTGMLAGALMLALPLCAAAADEKGTTAEQARKEVREVQREAEKKGKAAYDAADRKVQEVRDDIKDSRNAGMTQEDRDKATMDRLQQKEEGQTTGEYLDDAEVTAKVKGKFVAQKGLDSLDIKVVTVDGTVTLMGDVDSSAQIGLAESVAGEVEGVRRVDNKLVLK